MTRRAFAVMISVAMLFGYLPMVMAEPTIQFNSAEPNTDNPVGGKVIFNITVTDASEKPTVKMYVDDSYLGTMTTTSSSSPYVFHMLVDTTSFPDGKHHIRYEASDSDGEDAKTCVYVFDNSAPSVTNITVHYPKDFQAVSAGDAVFISAEISDMSGINASINASSVGINGNITMYDDGEHNDRAEGDGIYGTDWFYTSNSTGIYYLPLNVSDSLGNSAEHQIELRIDISPPYVMKASVVYPSEQRALKAGDEFRISAQIKDTVYNGVGGMKSAYADLTQLGFYEIVGLFDDGKHMDGNSSDGIYGSDILTLRDAVDGMKDIIVTGEDIAGNLQSYTLQVNLDSSNPEISEIKVVYPSGQTCVQDGQNISVQVNASDSESGICRVFMDASPVGASDYEELTFTGTYFESRNISVSTGQYTGTLRVKVSAVDNAGNTYSMYANVVVNNTEETSDSSSNTGSNTTDSKPPSIESVSIWDGEHLSGNVNISMVVWNDSAIIDTDSNPVIYIGSHAYDMSASNGEYFVVLNTSTLSDGDHIFTFVVRDSEGLSDSKDVAVVIDNSPPELYATSPPSTPISGDFELKVHSWDISGVSGISVKVDGNPYGNMASSGNDDYVMYIDTRDLGDGAHSIEITATDIFSHSSTASISISVDNTPPEITYLGSDTMMYNESASFRVSGAVSAQFSVDGGEWLPISLDSGEIQVYPGAFVGSEGMHYISIRAMDSAGNINETSVPVYIEMEQSKNEATESNEMEGRGNGGTGYAQMSVYILMLALILIALALVTTIYGFSSMRQSKVNEENKGIDMEIQGTYEDGTENPVEELSETEEGEIH